MILCEECGRPVKDKVDIEHSKSVLCSNCVQSHVNFIQLLEKESGMEIMNYIDLNKAYDIYKTKSPKEKDMVDDLLAIIKIKKIPRWRLAAILSVSKGHLANMLNRRKPLNKKALEFLSENMHIIPLKG